MFINFSWLYWFGYFIHDNWQWDLYRTYFLSFNKVKISFCCFLINKKIEKKLMKNTLRFNYALIKYCTIYEEIPDIEF